MASGSTQPVAAATVSPALSENSLGTAATPAIRIRGLNHRFGVGDISQQVLFDINLEVRPGELVILTGPSGCGKTTLLTLIGGLRSVQDGSLQVLERELYGLGKPEMIFARRNIGFIFQAHNLLEALTAVENVSLALDLKTYTAESLLEHAARFLEVMGDGGPSANLLDGVSHQLEPLARVLVNALLTHLALGDRTDYKPNQLSGGQKQRVAIARALINSPRLILADEPTAALDKGSSGVVIDLLKKMTINGTTILVVTHDNRIMDKGDRVVSMKDGRVMSNLLVDETIRICVFLQKVSLFSGMTPSSLVEVAEKMRKETYPAETVIIRQGAIEDMFYLVKEGKVDVLVENDQERRLVATLESGSFFGEVALLEDKPRNATVIAKERVELYVLQKEDFLRARSSFATMREELMKVFAQRYRPD